jgi:hypothetical protein
MAEWFNDADIGTLSYMLSPAELEEIWNWDSKALLDNPEWRLIQVN